MRHRMGKLLAERAAERFIGRLSELATLLGALEPAESGFAVYQVHGLAGIGKSRLLNAFSELAESGGARVVRLDCRAIEPTERGFLRALASATGGIPSNPDEAAEHLGRLGDRVILTLDNYEVYRLLDNWLRQVFAPALTDNIRVVLVGREPPSVGWAAAPEWRDLFKAIPLGPLEEADALEYLARGGVGSSDAVRINRIALGHPLALSLAAASAAGRWGAELEGSTTQRVVEELASRYLTDIEDASTRQALQATSVVRRVTVSILRALLPDTAAHDAFERLRALSFVESSPEGLVVHECVRTAIAPALLASDPAAYREFRRAAWRHLEAEARTASRFELWRYTADMLYLIENPVVREAFFPTAALLTTVEPASERDAQAVQAIAKRHEGSVAATLVAACWSALPQAFSVVRDATGLVVGFYCMFDPDTTTSTFPDDDPILRIWRQHVQHEPVRPGEHVLFLRRWLSLEHGEKPSPIQAACWLDIKRTYMAMRPGLRRIYLTVRDLPTYAPVATGLGFKPLTQLDLTLDSAIYHTAMLDFGPSSVDGWLAGLVGTELAIEPDAVLDIDAHELVMEGGQRIALTPLEFGVAHELWLHQGKIVRRSELLDHVWHTDYEGGSNVVDVVVASLRRKLGGHGSLIETARGTGYRVRGR